MTPEVAALLREREGYQRRRLPERVAAVDAELARLGHRDAPEAAVLPQPENAMQPKPRRSTR